MDLTLKRNKENWAQTLLQISAFTVLFGRGFLFLFQNEKGFHFLSSTSSLDKTAGILLLLSALAVFIRKDTVFSFLRYLLFLGALILLVHTVDEFVESGFRFALLIEHSLQVGVAVLLFFSLDKSLLKMQSAVLILLALTFIGHGMFAAGIYPVPDKFVELTQQSLGFSHESSSVFLLVAGIIDFIVSITIFIPALRRISLIYMTFWGILTAFARFYGPLGIAEAEMVFGANLFEFVFRMVHGLMPLSLFLLLPKGNWNAVPVKSALRSSS